MPHNKKILLSIIALATLTASIAIMFGAVGNPLRPASAQTTSVSSTDYYLSSGSDPWGTAFDSSGHVWVAVPGCDPSPMCGSNTPPGKIDVFNPATSSWSNIYTLPSGYAQPLFLAIDAQGNAWFTQPMGNSIGMLNPNTKTFQQWTVPTPSAGPWGIAIDHNGNIWFTEHYTNKIGSFNPTTQMFTEIATPASNSQPYGITIDGSNNIWFTENNSSVARIGEYTSGGTLKEYKVRTGSTSGLTPHLITVDPNGNIWWSEGWVTAIGELVVSQAVPGTNNGVTEYFYPKTCNNCGSHTSGISVDSNGQIWFDDSLQSTFGSFLDSGSGSFSIYNTPTSNSHPHDGLNVDSQNRIFFDEEFANKLAKAVQSGGSTSTPTPTPTVGTSPTPTKTPTPTPTATPSPTPSSTPGTTLAQDNFQRPNQKYWGTATDGHTWGSDAGGSSVFTITNNSGQVASGNTSYSAILGPSATNAEVLFTSSISSFNNTNIGAVLRWTDGNDWYKAYIDGTNLVVQKKVNGTTTILGTASFPATGATSYTLRFRVVGTSLYTKVWQTGTTEPTNWMVTATDSSLSSGYCGLRMLDQNGAVVTYTSFLATSE